LETSSFAKTIYQALVGSSVDPGVDPGVDQALKLAGKMIDNSCP
jgi:hypothetical protein